MTTPSVAQNTQTHGYWTDSSTGLMWAAKDNGTHVSWHKANKYCRNLRLGGNSDWRLPTIEELEGLVNLRAYATERVGDSDILHWNGDLQVNGGLLLTGDRQWSSSPLIDVDGRPSKASFWYFDYRRGWRQKGFEDIFEGDHMQAMCVRDSKAAQATSPNSAEKIVAQSPAENQNTAQEAQSTGSWVDPSTGIMWTARDNGKDVNLGEALKYCRELRLAQYSDWRLARIDELEGVRRSNVADPEPVSKREDQAFAYRLPEEISLTGDPWSSTPVSEYRGYPAIFEWYFGLNSRTRIFDEPSYSHAKRALCVRNSTAQPASRIGASSSNGRSSTGDQGSAPETQHRGYWIDPSSGLMWAARDNLQDFIIYSEATRYCHDLRLAHYSDWRLATFDELQGIYDEKAASPGVSPRSHDHEPKPRFFHVKGNLFLTGLEWGSTHPVGGGDSSEEESFFDFQNGRVVKDDHHSIRERRALCVRRSSK